MYETGDSRPGIEMFGGMSCEMLGPTSCTGRNCEDIDR